MEAEVLQADETEADDVARVRAGTALRRLGHAIVGHHTDVALLREVAAVAERWAAQAEAAAPRARDQVAYVAELARAAPADGGEIEHFADCPVSGRANPLGIAIEGRRDGDSARVRTVLGAAFEGAPGRAHGGIVAAVFDDAMGFVTSLMGVQAYQGELTIRYVEPTPVKEEIEVRAWPVVHEGRKLVVDAEITAGSTVTARAHGMHIVARNSATRSA
jgi:acyl-coenzyme A thioesterase PaaI-like protein